MEVRQRGLITGILTAVLLVAPFAAEAKRAGGGEKPRHATVLQQPTAILSTTSSSCACSTSASCRCLQPSKNPVQDVGGMVAAGVAGAAIGAVAANALADDQSVAASEAQAAQAEEEKGGTPAGSGSFLLLLLPSSFSVRWAQKKK